MFFAGFYPSNWSRGIFCSASICNRKIIILDEKVAQKKSSRKFLQGHFAAPSRLRLKICYHHFATRCLMLNTYWLKREEETVFNWGCASRPTRDCPGEPWWGSTYACYSRVRVFSSSPKLESGGFTEDDSESMWCKHFVVWKFQVPPITNCQVYKMYQRQS